MRLGSIGKGVRSEADYNNSMSDIRVKDWQPGYAGELWRRGKIVGMASRFALCLLMVSGMSAAGQGAPQPYAPPPPPLTVDPCAVQPNPKFPVAPDPKGKPVVCPPPSAPVAAPAVTNPGKPAAADAFPFPGDAAPVKTPAPDAPKPSTADQFPFPGSTAATPAGAPAVAKPNPAGGKPNAAGDAFPYPGETAKSPDAVPEGDTPRYVPDSPAPVRAGLPRSGAGNDSSSSSSSSSSGGDSPTAADDSKSAGHDDDEPAPRRHRPLPKVSALSEDERVTEDLKVAKFYSDRGNFTAAYLRGKDATKLMPSDAESHFVLAQAAQKLKKKDEAVAEYTLFLQLEPTGDRSAVAQKALSELK